MTKKIVAIWAQDEEGVIGKGNRPALAFASRTATLQRNNSESCYLDGACDL